MLLQRDGSKWKVMGDDRRRCYRVCKNRRDAERYMEYRKLTAYLANPSHKWPPGLLGRINELGLTLGERTYAP